jgi:hypothetical protein
MSRFDAYTYLHLPRLNTEHRARWLPMPRRIEPFMDCFGLRYHEVRERIMSVYSAGEGHHRPDNMHRDMVESLSFSFSFSDHTYRSSSPTISCLVAQEITVIRAKGAGTRVMSFDRIAIRTYHDHIYCISSDKGDTVTEGGKKKRSS